MPGERVYPSIVKVVRVEIKVDGGRLRLSPANFSKEYQVALFRFPKLLGSLKQNGIYPNSQKGPNALSFAGGLVGEGVW